MENTTKFEQNKRNYLTTKELKSTNKITCSKLIPVGAQVSSTRPKNVSPEFKI